ncbi:nuclease-related domain-containing protein [Microbacterium sp. NPDC089698]|uniref:nuclease-related domain-containing protein n=1 Tax=unclassified Microbacterium TaxID=2609290 RepID=UPI002852D2CE|nr:nuclease-related domain-containing protein [Microbacterium sp.]
MQRLFGRTPLSPDAQSWYLGAIGELEVGRILDRLGPEWRTLHAVPVGKRGSDIDHVVIGPGGVFTINTKHHDGAKVWVGGHRILVNGQRTDHLRNADFEATRAAKILGAATHQTVDATPILAIVGAKSIQIKEKPPRVEVLRAEALVRRLEHAPRILTPADVTMLDRVAVVPETWGSSPPPEADLTAFAALRTEVVSAFRRRQAWAAGGILAVMAALITPGAIVLLSR